MITLITNKLDMKSIKNILIGLLALAFIVININAVNYNSNSKSSLESKARSMGVKDAICGAIQCGGGDRVCGTAGATVSVEIEGVGAEVEVVYTCYEDS